jgi:DNA-binding LacI/PurR family transcriptional regulator
MTVKKKPRVTTKHIAELVGVSPTTVSFVLNGVDGANISAETSARVLQAARELNYVPDTAARSLARGYSNTIAFLLAQPHEQVFQDEYIPKLLTGISEVTRRHGFRIIVELAENEDLSRVYTKLLASKEAAGIIINFNNVTEAEVEQVRSAAEHSPIVSTFNVHPDVYSVEVDKLDGVRQMMRHLLALGHTRIGCISYAPRPISDHANQRVRIVQDMQAEAGFPMDERLLTYGAFDPQTGYEAAQPLLDLDPLPTVIFGLNDLMAIGAIRAIQERGLRIPQDIAVVGFDDIRIANFTSPPLTTMHEPDIDHGRIAAESLFALMRGKIPPVKHVNLQTTLIIRESCGYSVQHKGG